VLETWNDTTAPYPRDATMATLFAEQAKRTPDAIALVHGDAALTYAELEARVNRLANYLRMLGAGPEVRVGVCLSRTPDLVTALLAVQAAGAAYVPLDPAYPEDRVAFMLADSAAPIVVTEATSQALVMGHATHVVVLDDEGMRAAIAAMPATCPAFGARPDSLAYVIYTSGSTGRPKGVAIEHRNAVAFIAWAQAVFTRAELSGVLAATSVCFDLSVFELFVTLASGGAVILADSVLALPSLSAASRVTLVNTVPSAMAELVATGLPSSVRTVNLAGEPLATSLVDRIYALGSVERVYDLYGPSEDTTYSTFTLRRRGEAATIGRPIANTYAYVLDERRVPRPIGVPGEL
jgi:amino acid adenylation domain-containing protein